MTICSETHCCSYFLVFVNALRLGYFEIKIIWPEIMAEIVCKSNALRYRVLCREITFCAVFSAPKAIKKACFHA